MRSRLTCRLRPGNQSEAYLRSEYARAQWVWNECVHASIRSGSSTAVTLGMMLDDARSAVPWLQDGSHDVQRQTVHEYVKALERSKVASGSGRPRRRSRRRNPFVSLNYTMLGFRVRGNVLVLSGGVSLPITWDRKLPSLPASVRVFEDATGGWWASFDVEISEADAPRKSRGGKKVRQKASTLCGGDVPDFSYQGRAVQQARRLVAYQRRGGIDYHGGIPAPSKAYRRAKYHASRVHRTVRWHRKEFARMCGVPLNRNPQMNVSPTVEHLNPAHTARTPVSAYVACGA